MKTTIVILSILCVIFFVNILNLNNDIDFLKHKHKENKKHIETQSKMVVRQAELNIRLNNLCDRFQSSRNAKHNDEEIQDLMFKLN